MADTLERSGAPLFFLPRTVASAVRGPHTAVSREDVARLASTQGVCLTQAIECSSNPEGIGHHELLFAAGGVVVGLAGQFESFDQGLVVVHEAVGPRWCAKCGVDLPSLR